jgi:molybdopterin molybdotransferase
MMVTAVRANALAPRRDRACPRRRDRMESERIRKGWMRSVEDQQIKVTAAAVAPRPVRVAISEAQGLLCAEDVVTERPLPGFDQAAIDGYAVRSVDVASAGADIRDEAGDLVDLTLPVVGEVVAGSRQPIRLQPRQTVRVDTGAPMPTLADAVLPLDFTGEDQGVRAGALRRLRAAHRRRRAAG